MSERRELDSISEPLARRVETTKDSIDSLIAAIDEAIETVQSSGLLKETGIKRLPLEAAEDGAEEAAAAAEWGVPTRASEAASGGFEDVAVAKPSRKVGPDSPPPRGASDGARLLATQMAVSGSSRQQIEARLRGEFGVADAAEIADEVLGS